MEVSDKEDIAAGACFTKRFYLRVGSGTAELILSLLVDGVALPSGLSPLMPTILGDTHSVAACRFA